MKTIILSVIALLFLISCEKDQPNYCGEYIGFTETYMAGVSQYNQARRTITDNGEGTFKIHWWDSKDVNCYTVIENGEYLITNVEILAEPYCFVVKSKHFYQYCGKGKFIGDSLVEEGIMYHYVDSLSTRITVASTTWRGCFKILP